MQMQIMTVLCLPFQFLYFSFSFVWPGCQSIFDSSRDNSHFYLISTLESKVVLLDMIYCCEFYASYLYQKKFLFIANLNVHLFR